MKFVNKHPIIIYEIFIKLINLISGDGVRRGGKNGDSYNRLFGESDRPFTPAKNHLKSNIPLGGDSPAKINNGNNAATNGHTNGKAENNNGVQQNGTSKTGKQILINRFFT